MPDWQMAVEGHGEAVAEGGADALERSYGRTPAQARPLTITRGYYDYAEGSVLIETGRTTVLCVATIAEDVPRWMKGKGTGWVTAEYGMLPRSSAERIRRDAGRNIGGRTQEIQRLIGRALRSVTDLEALGERSITIDCDVLQADGGTRTAAITGGFIALADALVGLVESGQLPSVPLIDYLAAISVGIVDGTVCLDLDYPEDSAASVDMNLVMTGTGKMVEVQGTAEGHPFSLGEFDQLVTLGHQGISRLVAEQKALLQLPLKGA